MPSDSPAETPALEALRTFSTNRETWSPEETSTAAEKLVSETQSLVGENHALHLVCLTELAESRKTAGQWKEAAQTYQEVIQRRLATLGLEHPLTAQAIQNLGLFFQEIGEHDTAEPLFLQAIDIWTRTGRIESSISQAMGGAFKALQLQKEIDEFKASYQAGSYHEAVKSMASARGLAHQHFGPEHSTTLEISLNMAETYRLMGAAKAAEADYVRLLESAHPAKQPELLELYTVALNGLATLLQQRGNLDDAETLFARAVNITSEGPAAQSTAHARSLNNLAVLYLETKDYLRAEQLVARSIVLTEKAHGRMHPDFASQLHVLASIESRLGHLESSISLQEEGLEIQLATLGQRHPLIARTLLNIAHAFIQVGRVSEAEKMMEQALELQRSVLSVSHPDVAMTLLQQAMLSAETADAMRAIQLLNAAREIYEANGLQHLPVYRQTYVVGARVLQFVGKPHGASSVRSVRFRNSLLT